MGEHPVKGPISLPRTIGQIRRQAAKRSCGCRQPSQTTSIQTAGAWAPSPCAVTHQRAGMLAVSAGAELYVPRQSGDDYRLASRKAVNWALESAPTFVAAS